MQVAGTSVPLSADYGDIYDWALDLGPMESARRHLTGHRRGTCLSRQRSGPHAPTADHRGFPVRGSSTSAQASSARRSAVINRCCSAGGTDPGVLGIDVLGCASSTCRATPIFPVRGSPSRPLDCRGQQLLDVCLGDRFGQSGVGGRVILDVQHRGDGDRAGGIEGPEPAGQFPAVHAWQSQVQHDQIQVDVLGYASACSASAKYCGSAGSRVAGRSCAW